MKFSFKLLEKVKNQAGATAVVVAIVLPMLIGFGALAVDVGYMHVTKNELQNVADAAALAATRKLGTIYQGMTFEAQQAYVCGTGNDDITVIKGVADAVAHNNKAGGEHITVHDMTEGIEINEVEIGDWNSNTAIFKEKNEQPDAVRVTARRDGSANGPITTFFAKIFGIDFVDVSADATAALTGQTISEPGEIELPLGISELAATPDKCDQDVMFSPTAEACAGWNTFFTSPSSNDNLLAILKGMRDGTIEGPATISGQDKFDFTGGKLSAEIFDELMLLFKDKGYDINADGNPVATYVDDDGNTVPVIGHLDADKLSELAENPDVFTINGPVVPLLDPITGDPSLYPDGGIETVQVFDPETGDPVLDPETGEPTYTDNYISLTPRNKHEWPTKVVVYEEEGPDCENPGGSLLIVGYATILLTNVTYKAVEGNLECELVSNDDTRGGGGEYGTKSSIPSLVE